MNKVILSFCAGCGQLARPTAPRCDNCGEELLPSDGRIEGVFNEDAAKKFYLLMGYDDATNF